MRWDFITWLHEHRSEIEASGLAVVQDLPAYVARPADERLSCWSSLVDVLLTDQARPPVEQVRQWAAREMQERGATPSELLTITEALSRTIHDLVPPKVDAARLNGCVNALGSALAHYFAERVERLAVEKSQLEALYEIARELTASLDLSRMLHRTLAEVVSAISAEMGAIFLVDRETREVIPETVINWDGGDIAAATLPSAWQMGQAEPLLVLNDLPAEQPEAWVQPLLAPSMRSLMAAPLVANGEFIGLLAVASCRRGVFDSNCVRLFRAILSQIATSIGNAEVYRLITEQAQELGRLLRHQQEESTKSQAILTSIGDGVVVNNAEGRTILVNPAAERILDKSAEELDGQDYQGLFSVFNTEGRQEAIAAMEVLLNAPPADLPKAFKMTLEFERRIVYAHLSPVLTQRGDFLGVVTILRDVTKEVEADRTKSEFVSTVSHELRTPMTAIKGYADLLHAGAVGPINEEQERFLSIIQHNADRLTALINDLLDISRVETGRARFDPRPVQVGDVIADVVNALAGQAKAKQQKLTYEVVGGLSDLMGDRDRLNQVLTNLVGNAIRYTPKGGEIEVRAYPVEGAVRVDVRDTGIGISSEDLGCIFERFYRASHPMVQEASGSGLGLAIAKMFVEMHGGRVWVESEEGKGSTFTILLPLPVHKEQESLRLPPRLIARTRTVLVVEDEPDIAKLIKIQLENGGYQVCSLGNGPAVVPWVEDKKPDLIMLDLLLPDMSGLEILRALKSNLVTADIPVIVMTIVPDDGVAWNLGIVDYLTKPVPTADLLRSVEKALTWQGRVLIVDDDEDTVGLLSAAMRQIGFTPLVAANGYEALAMTRRHRPDLIILDLRLPGMDGYEAVTHLKRDGVTQTIPIIAISAHAVNVDQERKRLVALGAASFLPKPFSIGELLDEIESALKPAPRPTSS